MIFKQAEEFEVNEAAPDPKGIDASAPRFAQVIFDLLFDVKEAALLIVHDLHDRSGRVIPRLQKGLTVASDYRIVGKDLTGNKFFHDELHAAKILIMKGSQLFVAVDLEGVHRSDAVVRFSDHGIADFLDEGEALGKICHKVISG